MKKMIVPMMLAWAAAINCLAADDILFADFEGDTYGDWKVEGESFGKGPVKEGVRPPNNPTVGHKGRGYINTYLGGDAPKGTLTSPVFTIERKYINFLVGAGNHDGETCMNLLVNGKIVKSACGPAAKDNQGREILHQASWDVSEYRGKNAVLQIVDNHSGGWGHINIDHIVQSDSKPAGTTVPDDVILNRVSFSKTLKVDNTHLHVPVCNTGKGRMHLAIYDGDRQIQSFNVVIPKEGDAFWTAAYPLAHFNVQGREITVKPVNDKPQGDIFLKAFNSIRCGPGLPGDASDDYGKPYRNQFHASTRRGWNNDPNGMAYHNGKYHLYLQHNPFGINWGNMHWNHLESADLIHWEEKPIALYQRTTGDMMFSGGGFVDFNNSAGLGKNVLFAAFTSTGRGECLAFSTDNGLTFTELPENPVVKHRGRDPKVIWYEPQKKWVMALFDSSPCAETEAVKPSDPKAHPHDNIAFYESKDLRKWTRTGAFTDPDRLAVFECPELFELPVDGATERRWITYGAQNRYFIGQFNGSTFIKESGPHGSRHGAFYAAQTFSDVPDGRRIQIGWVRTAIYTDDFPDQIVNQAFTLPHTMTLVKTPDGLRIAFNPVRECEKLRGHVLAEGNDMSIADAQKALQTVRGKLSEVVIEFADGGEHQLVVNGIDAAFVGKDARIFTDRTFNETYADNGLYYEVRTKGDLKATETAIKDEAGKVKSLKAYELKSIW